MSHFDFELPWEECERVHYWLKTLFLLFIFSNCCLSPRLSSVFVSDLNFTANESRVSDFSWIQISTLRTCGLSLPHIPCSGFRCSLQPRRTPWNSSESPLAPSRLEKFLRTREQVGWSPDIWLQPYMLLGLWVSWASRIIMMKHNPLVRFRHENDLASRPTVN